MPVNVEFTADVVAFPELIPDAQKNVYARVLHEAQEEGLDFALGGAIALGVYTGRWRNTKDVDLYILPKDRRNAIDLLTRCGLADYYETEPYDRKWIYRSTNGDAIVDVIWAMANGRSEVDEAWLRRGRVVETLGERVRSLPAEELLWSKLYVLQRDRCDWPDVLNIIHAVGRDLDWMHLRHRIGGDEPLLRGALSVFSWLSPERARELPHWLWAAMELPYPDSRTHSTRESLLDSRNWLGPSAKMQNGSSPA